MFVSSSGGVFAQQLTTDALQKQWFVMEWMTFGEMQMSKTVTSGTVHLESGSVYTLTGALEWIVFVMAILTVDPTTKLMKNPVKTGLV